MSGPREQPYPGETEEHQRQREMGAGPNDEVYHTYRDDDGNTVKQYDMDAEEIVVTPGVHVDWNQVVSHMIEVATRRVESQIGYVHVAVGQFHAQSDAHIAQFIADNTPAPEHGISFSTLVDGLIEGVGAALFPEAEFAKIVFETAGKFLASNVEKAMEEAAHPLEGARAKLSGAVGALVTQVEHNTVTAVDEGKAQVEHVIRQGMADQQHPTNDPAWIDEMLQWMGFPERTEGTVTAPVLQWLEYQFTALLTQVQQEVHAEMGH